ncbi:MAG: site-specific tyrosine recombinase XerD [Propionibacteriaceae bacterium]|nr:site-specific tyrosine recombinase XerD [Propionibacteriaceae bacterium]
MSALERVLGAYLDHLEAEVGASVHTVAGYRRDLARYGAFLADRGVASIAEVRPEQVEEFAAWLRSDADGGPGLAASSVARAVAAVRGLHGFAVRDGDAEANPATRVSPPQQGRRLPKALSLEQVQALLDVPDPSTPTGLRDAALLELLYGTGARVSEVCALDVDDVSAQLDDPDLGLRLFGKGRKERIVPLGSYARAAIGAWLVRGRPVFSARATRATPALLLNARGGRLSRQSAFNILTECAERAQIGVPVSPHTLRHSFATHLLDGGADVRVVQELLGHASVTTTQIYTLVTAEHLREVFLGAHPRAR